MRFPWSLLVFIAFSISARDVEGDETAELSVLTWNIMAPMWVDLQYYENSSKFDINLLDRDIRLQLVIDRILESRVDIVTLQEVQEDTFPIIRDKLKRHYNPVTFAPNTDNYWEEFLPKGGEYVKNGVATFYRKKRLALRSAEDVRVIPTSDRGSVALLTVLWPKRHAFLGRGRRDIAQPIISINNDLETGVDQDGAEKRVAQATIIATAAAEIKTALVAALPDINPVTIWSGDFSSMSGFPTIETIKGMGFVDAMEAMGVSHPTYYSPEPVTLPGNITVVGVAIDHVFISAAEQAAGQIAFVSVEVPNIFSTEFSEEGHTTTLIHMLTDQMRRERFRRRTQLITYLLSSDLFNNLYTSFTDETTYDEYEPVRALRSGSDHSLVKAVMTINFPSAP